MSDHEERGHHRNHETKAQASAPPETKTPYYRRFHKDWKVWVVVGLMLVAMVTYVMTMNEAVQPGGGPPKQEIPAAP